MRLFKSIEEYIKLQKALAAKKAPMDLVLEATQCTGMIMRWGYDNLAFFEKAKILPKAAYGVTSNKYRTVATVAYIISCVKALLKANSDCSAAQDKKSADAAQSARFEATLGLSARIADLCNAVHSAKYYQTNEGLQGLCGFWSSFLALRKVWKAIK
jgi:hypothetical protein